MFLFSVFPVPHFSLLFLPILAKVQSLLKTVADSSIQCARSFVCFGTFFFSYFHSQHKTHKYQSIKSNCPETIAGKDYTFAIVILLLGASTNQTHTQKKELEGKVK